MLNLSVNFCANRPILDAPKSLKTHCFARIFRQPSKLFALANHSCRFR
jgi:hypothetical protein